MSYEVRISGKAVDTFEDPDAALAFVRDAVQIDPDSEPEIIDTTTGKAFEPASSKSWRDDLAKTIR